jgi:DNA-binding response OmpR family regulator
MGDAKIAVLLIDDDVKLADLLNEYMKRFGIVLHSALHPDEGMKLLRTIKPRLVILDVMLPGRDGFEVCREIRSKSNIPVLMLTARGETMDRIIGLELGADDYLSKPFEPRELVARIHTILRRAGSRPSDARLQFGDLEIRVSERDAYLNGEALALSTMEYELFYLFATNPQKKFDRDEIMSHLRGFDADVYSRSIDILVSRLRSKLKDDPKSPRYIKTVWGTGYVFVGVEE